jgi:heterodisulfide reductase subunit A-like polyferredoxin
MLAAFFAAGLAHIRARLANGCSELAAATHVSGSHAADLRTVHIKRNAARHHFDVLLLQASRSAMVAGDCAGIAGIDAGLKLLM